MLVALAGTLAVLGIADAVSGIWPPVYFWVTGGIVGLGLLAGVVLRRTPWSMAPLLIPALVGMIAFGNSGASLHDGVGQHDWTPTSAGALKADYRLAFGQGTLDLRSIGPVTTPRDVGITMAAGQVRILLPRGLNATVLANVRIGVITVDGGAVASTWPTATSTSTTAERPIRAFPVRQTDRKRPNRGESLSPRRPPDWWSRSYLRACSPSSRRCW